MLIDRGDDEEEGAEEDERDGMAEARFKTEAAPEDVADCKLDVEKRDEAAAAAEPELDAGNPDPEELLIVLAS